MTDDFDMPDIDSLVTLFTEAVRTKLKAAELENEALKMRLNEARLKLDLAKTKLDEAGVDSTDLDIYSQF
jgi:hypothetical protein